MANFEFLINNQFDKYANEIYNILADNMSIIAPTGNTREDDFIEWYRAVGEGLKKENRHIILISENETNQIIGYFQYYTNIDTFMMEEIQICHKFQGKDNIFRDLYGFVLKNISTDLLYVEAYANKLNHKSIGILGKLGLKIVGENRSGKSFHFKGNFADLMSWYMNGSVFYN